MTGQNAAADKERRNYPELAEVYSALWPDLKRLARSHGWAACLHGSLITDMDIVLLPWEANAAPLGEVVKAWSGLVGMRVSKLHQRPHGRVSFTVALCRKTYAYLDVSAYPRYEQKQPAAD